MARTNNLSNFLTDVADAIRTKKGSEELIAAADFDTEIENLPSGADLSEYFTDTIDKGSGGGGVGESGWIKCMKKCPAFTPLDINYQDCGYMFCHCPWKEIDLSNFTKVYNMANMFAYSPRLENLDLSPMGYHDNLKNVSGAFQGLTNLKTINFGTFAQKRGITNFTQLFRDASKISSLDLSTFKTDDITTMQQMFYGCTNLQTINFAGFNTEKVTDMGSMFYNCNKLATLDLSSFNTPLLTKASSMFSSCRLLTKIDMRNFIFSGLTSFTNMFGSSASNGVPNNCEIIVKDDTEKSWITTNFSRLTNVKTVVEYGAEQNA